jgi:hypothetical protein
MRTTCLAEPKVRLQGELVDSTMANTAKYHTVNHEIFLKTKIFFHFQLQLPDLLQTGTQVSRTARQRIIQAKT